MEKEIINMIILSTIFIGIFTLGEILYRIFKIKIEYTRKFSHISVGIITLTFPYFFSSHWFVFFLFISFFILLFLSKKYNFLPSINNVERTTYGSYVFPLSIYLMFCISEYYEDKIFYYIPILFLTLSDSLAAIAGTKWKYKFLGKFSINGNTKTIFGSIIFFFVSMCISVTAFIIECVQFNWIFIFLLPFILSICSMCVEIITPKGLDNISVPVTVSVLLILMKMMFNGWC